MKAKEEAYFRLSKIASKINNYLTYSFALPVISSSCKCLWRTAVEWSWGVMQLYTDSTKKEEVGQQPPWMHSDLLSNIYFMLEETKLDRVTCYLKFYIYFLDVK